jgi:hypothetical protein
MVVVDKLTKVAHFILVNLTHKVSNIANVYMGEISWLHGIRRTIVFERDPKFISNFWKGFQTNLNFSTTYHPELGH